MSARCPLLVGALLLATGVVHAEDQDLVAARASFNAGAIAYAAGDYLAAIQALDEAYRLTPLPAIAFSLAQAERRQYFVSQERTHLERARSLYRRYLDQVPTGGRRADATDALGQLEALAAALETPAGGAATAPTETPKTRLLVTSGAPKATVSLDGSAGVVVPLIAEVAPGPHHVRVEAAGFFSADRSVVAVPGALVPVELALSERPARVVIVASSSADLYLDGRYAGKVGRGALTLPSGTHSFEVASNGHTVATLHTVLERGTTRTWHPELGVTGQRTAALVLFGVSGGALLAGAAFGALSLSNERDATKILDRRAQGNISPRELRDYDEAVRHRNQLRAVAIAGFGASAITLVTGVLLYELDAPVLRGPSFAPEGPGRIDLSLSPVERGLGVSSRLRF